MFSFVRLSITIVPLAPIRNRHRVRREPGWVLQNLIRSGEALRSSHPSDLTAVFVLSNCYRELAAITDGERRRQALLHSAAAWRAWPATSYTKREEQRDLTAASR